MVKVMHGQTIKNKNYLWPNENEHNHNKAYETLHNQVFLPFISAQTASIIFQNSYNITISFIGVYIFTLLFLELN